MVIFQRYSHRFRCLLANLEKTWFQAMMSSYVAKVSGVWGGCRVVTHLRLMSRGETFGNFALIILKNDHCIYVDSLLIVVVIN